MATTRCSASAQPGTPRARHAPGRVRRAALGLLALAVVTGCGLGRSPKPSHSSAEARRIVVGFVEDTARATTAGLKTDVLDDGRKPEACSLPGETHNWAYEIHVDVRGERAKKLVDDVAAYWRAKGHKVTTKSEPGALVRFDRFSFGVHGSGADGQFGMIIGGSSPCLPGRGSPVS